MSLPHTDENCSHMPCRYERLAWIPVLIVYLVALGVGGKHLTSSPPAEPATAPAILSFGATIAGFVITYCSLSSDFTIYYARSVPSWRLFMYSYLGFNIPIVRHRRFPLQVIYLHSCCRSSCNVWEPQWCCQHRSYRRGRQATPTVTSVA